VKAVERAALTVEATEALIEMPLMLKGLPPDTASSSHSVSSISSYIANVLSVSTSTSAIGLRPQTAARNFVVYSLGRALTKGLLVNNDQQPSVAS
jgi:hypothetical protein